MKRLILVAAGCLLLAPAAQADTVKRIATTKRQAVRHVHDHLGLGTGIVATHATDIRCKPSKLTRARKSKTWKCSFRYRDNRLSDNAPLVCRVRYRIGLERRVTGRAWNDRKLGSKTCRRA